MATVTENRDALAYAREYLKNDEVVIKVIDNYPSALQYVSEQLKN